MTKKLISIVIPAYQEEKNISLIYAELVKILSQVDYDYEIIFVNDGSSDNTRVEIKKISLSDKNVKGIDLSRNFGKEIALTAGIEYARGDAVITLDVDGQHPAIKLPDFISEWEKGYDVVYNKRPETKNASFLKKISSKLFYAIFNRISEFKLEPGTTDYRLLDRKAVDYLLQFKEKNRIYRGLVDWLGFKRKALIFDAEERKGDAGASYSYGKLFKLALDSLTSFSLFPLKLVGYLGVIIIIFSSVVLCTMFINKFFRGNSMDFTNTAFLIVFSLLLSGVSLTALGLIALYIGNIHEEVRGRPLYVIKEKI